MELAWKELKEGIVGVAMKVCGTTRKRRGETKRSSSDIMRKWLQHCNEVVASDKLHSPCSKN